MLAETSRTTTRWLWRGPEGDGVRAGCGDGEGAEDQELHPEEGILDQTAKDGGALSLSLPQKDGGGEEHLFWPGAYEVYDDQGNHGQEPQKGQRIPERH